MLIRHMNLSGQVLEGLKRKLNITSTISSSNAHIYKWDSLFKEKFIKFINHLNQLPPKILKPLLKL